jgi:uncharacterized delta-60 repeat protein
MTYMLRPLINVLLFLSSFQLAAQAGGLDFSFNSSDVGYRNGLGFSSGVFDQVEIIQELPDGRTLLAGVFTSYNGTALGGIVRLKPDGLVDDTFQSGSGFQGSLRAMVQDPMGGCFIGGQLIQYDGTPIGHLVRLNDDGSLDDNFPAGSGPNGEIRTILLQPNGTMIIGGLFTAVDGTPRANIARLHPDGSLDLTFDPGSGTNGPVEALAVQADGSVVIGGAFTSVNGTALNRIARLTATGAVDPTFQIGLGASGAVLDLAIQSDGKILLQGEFTTVNAVARQSIARLNTTGGVDATFFSPGFSGGNLLAMTLLPDGKILVGGGFLSVGGQPRNRIARLGTNGLTDNTFVPVGGVGGWVRVIQRLSDGRFLLGGQFNTYAGVWRLKVVRISAEGVLDMTFNPGSGASGAVIDMVAQSDGRIVLGGNFTAYNGVVRMKMARINEDGSLDPTFDPGVGPNVENDRVESINIQSDGKILVGGAFSTWSGGVHRRLVRLLPDGSLDPSFVTGSGLNQVVLCVVSGTNGRIYVGGIFTAYNGSTSNRLACLDAGGSIDATFVMGTGFNSLVRHIVPLSDGKLLVSGDFTSYNGAAVGRIVRLNADGSLDATFLSSVGANGSITSMAVWPDGRILISGQFSTYGGAARNGIARLLSNGSIDPSFTVGSGVAGSIRSLLPIAGGQCYLSGSFNGYDGAMVNGLVRLLSDGSLDVSFDPGAGPEAMNPALSILALPNERLLIGGNFISYDNIGRNHIARVHTSPALLLQLQVMLGGAYDPDVDGMTATLSAEGLLPLSEPYSVSGLSLNGFGGEAVPSNVLTMQPGANNVVDWVQVRLSTAAQPAVPVALRNVFVGQDGRVMDIDGSNIIAINGVPPGEYHVSVLHRNHLPIATALPLALSSIAVPVDLTDPSTPTWGASGQQNINGTMVLWPGDANFDGTTSYTGSGNDRDLVLQAIGGSTPTNVVNGVYSSNDINLDGTIRYTGANNDRDIILQTIGGAVPTAVRVGQVP